MDCSTGLIFLLVTVSLECKGASVIGPKIEGAQEIKIDSIGSLENQFFPHRIYEESSIESRQESNVKEIPEALKVNIEENRLDQTVNDKGRTIYNVMGIRNEGPQGTFVMEDIYAFLERIWNPLTENLLQPLFQFLQLLVLAPFFARRAQDTINYAPNPLQRFNQDYIDEYPTVIGTVRQTELQESTQEAQESQSSVANWARVATGLVALVNNWSLSDEERPLGATGTRTTAGVSSENTGNNADILLSMLYPVVEAFLP